MSRIMETTIQWMSWSDEEKYEGPETALKMLIQLVTHILNFSL